MKYSTSPRDPFSHPTSYRAGAKDFKQGLIFVLDNIGVVFSVAVKDHYTYSFNAVISGISVIRLIVTNSFSQQLLFFLYIAICYISYKY